MLLGLLVNDWTGLLVSSGLVLLPLTLIMVLLFEESTKFRYIFKFCFIVLYVSTVSLFLAPVMALFMKVKDTANAYKFMWTIRPLSKLIGMKCEIVAGICHLEKDSAAVIVCNHQSILDFMVMAELWKSMKRCAAVSKREILYIFPFGLTAWLAGTVFINRQNSHEAHVTLSETGQEVIDKKTKLWIFPEGTRYKGDELKEFKKGAFHIASQYKLPIIPIVVSPYTFVNDSQMTFDQGKVLISVLEPIQYRDGVSVAEMTKITRDLMNQEFGQLRAGVTKKS